jgi:hypothetical protein
VTIRRGEEWGTQVPVPADIVWAESDHDIVTTTAPVGLAGGDVHRSVGSPGRRDPVQRVEVDGLRVVVDGGAEQWAVAHVVARRSWWRGRIVAVMNVDHIGDWYVAPRGHPNDGLFDVVEVVAEMPFRQRLAARSRLPTGAHVPHPMITTARDRSRTWTFDRHLDIWIDGIRTDRGRSLAVEIVPDRYTVHF